MDLGATEAMTGVTWTPEAPQFGGRIPLIVGWTGSVATQERLREDEDDAPDAA